MNLETDISPLALAYVGDAALELLVRQKLVNNGNLQPHLLHQMALEYVTAKKQRQACERLKPCLTPEESEIFRRAKNAKSNSNPRSATLYEYRMATGLEAVFGYNSLMGLDARNRQLFEAAYGQDENNIDINIGGNHEEHQ